VRLAAAILSLALGACASFDGRGLAPGKSTAQDVDNLMGPAAQRLARTDGETWLYYPRQPFGRATYVARIAPDGKLVAIEQRLTDENIAKIRVGETRREQVAELLGPPYGVTNFPRLQRDVWQYHIRRFGNPGMLGALFVQFSPDGIAREVMFQEERESWLERGLLDL
jgi:hypothetical protein